MPRIIAPLLGVIGGFMGIGTSIYILFVGILISAIVGGEPESGFLVSILGWFVGAVLGVIGGSMSWGSPRTGGLVLLAGGILAFLSTIFAVSPDPGLFLTVYFSWVLLILLAGMTAMLRSLLSQRESNTLDKQNPLTVS